MQWPPNYCVTVVVVYSMVLLIVGGEHVFLCENLFYFNVIIIIHSTHVPIHHNNIYNTYEFRGMRNKLILYTNTII